MRVHLSSLYTSSYLTGVLFYLVTLAIHQSTAQKNRCSYELWDEAYEGRGVKRLEFNCASGKIEWHGPYGGLFINIHGPAKEHQLCVQVRSVHISASLSTIPDDDSLPQKLLTLNETKNDTQAPTSTLCVPASGSTLLLVEPDIGGLVSSKIFIDYDIEISPRYGEDACRPCTDEELLYYYCTSDFVAIGSMVEVKPTAAANVITLSLDLLKQQSVKYFTKDTIQREKYSGLIYTPAQCKMHYGSGKFIFMGKMKFGKAELRCAPRYEDFYDLQMDSKLKGTLLCT